MPPQCVLDALSNAALDACDELDGVKDSIIALPGSCTFNASEIVGQDVTCTNPNGTVTITDKMAQFVQGFWDGPRTDSGDFFWYSFGARGPLHESVPAQLHDRGRSAPTRPSPPPTTGTAPS